MSKVALVTDSTAYIPEELLNKYTIRVAPQVLVWDGDTLLDGIDIQPEEFYNRLQVSTTMPSTSQASPKAFAEIFQELRDKDYEVLAVLVSEQLSGTIASAMQALEKFEGEPIEVVDSRTTAMAMGFQVLGAARLAEQGASLEECSAYVLRAREHTGVVFAVDTLEFLHRGGRIGGASRLVGSLLNLKPILEVTGGVVEPVDKVRTRKKSLARLLDLVEERVSGKQNIRIASLHTNVPEEARELLSAAEKCFHPIETVFSTVSPVVGTHAGPGTLGIAWIAGVE